MISVPSFCQAQTSSPESILAATREATGGAAWNQVAEVITDGKLQVGERTTSMRYIENLKTGRNVLHYEFPAMGVKGAQGRDSSQSWEQDVAGDITLANDAGSQESAADLYFTRRGYWEPNFGGASVMLLPSAGAEQSGYHRLEIHPRGGHGSILWINRQTHLIERVDMGEHPSLEVWSDYREVNGVRMPFKVSIITGGQEMIVSSKTVLSSAREMDFAIPFRRDYQLPESGKATVPFFSSMGVMLKAKINGQGPFTVMLDSGASASLISADLAKQLGLKVDGQGTLEGMSGTAQAGQTSIKSVQIGDLVLRDQDFSVTPFPYSLAHSWKEPVVALIGYPIFRQLAVEIDYRHSQVTFYDGPTFKYSGKGTAVPMEIKNSWFVVDGTVDGVPGKFSLDTGQDVSLTLFTAFVESNNLVKKSGAQFHGVSGESYGGLEHAYFVRSKTPALGSVEAHDLLTHLSQDAAGIAAHTDGGNVGTAFFRQFTVTFDAMHQKLFLEKNGDYGKPEIFDRAGMVYQLVPEGAKVLNVFEGSPAAAAGIAEGDVLTVVNGLYASDPAFATIDDVFLQPVGTTVHVTVQHGSWLKKMDLILRDVL